MSGIDRPTATTSHCGAYRSEAGLTQVQVAGLARTTAGAVRRCDRGEIMFMEVGILIRVSAVLECGVADLFPVLGPVRDSKK